MRRGSIEAHLRSMVEELVDLAAKCNEARLYDEAAKVQGAVLVLDKLADASGFDNAAWPAKVEREPDGYRSLIWAPDDDKEARAP